VDVRPCEGFRRCFLRGPFHWANRDFFFSRWCEVSIPRPALPSKVPCLLECSYVPDHWGSLDSPGPTAPSSFSDGCWGFFTSDTVPG